MSLPPLGTAADNRRPHSHTISSAQLRDTNTRDLPLSPRRNSEGSPRQPPTTPIKPDAAAESPKTLSLQRHFPEKLMTAAIAPNETEHDNSNANPTCSAPSPAPPVAAPETPVARLLADRNRSRSRGSSVSIQNGNNDNSVSDNPSSNAQQLQVSDLSSDSGDAGIGFTAAAPGSVAAACNLEVANEKRNQDFHQLFRSVPEDDPLIEDFGCALQKEILLQGRIYISENHLCFNANIFGWVTNLVVAFSDIVDIEKRTTALFIPNAIQVSTLQAKHFFASFLSRDQAYDLLMDVWRQSRPQSDKAKSSDDQKSSSNDEDADEMLDESDTSSGIYTYMDGSSISDIGSDYVVYGPSVTGTGSDQHNMDDATFQRDRGRGAEPHRKTECPCARSGEHYPKTVLDETFPCTVQKLYSFLYEGDFLERFLQDQKNTGIEIGAWHTGQEHEKATRDISYTKLLNGSIGPKSTKCILKEEIYHKDMDDYVSQVTTTQTPDVPSGGSFSVKTKTCLMWGDKGQARMLVTVLVDFTKSSWIKSTIESASISGQEQYYKSLSDAIHRSVSKIPSRRLEDVNKKRVKRRKTRKRRNKADEGANERSLSRKIVSDTMDWTTRQLSSFSIPQLIMLCMLVLVGLNIYVARKVSRVDDRLESLHRDTQKPSGQQGSNSDEWLHGSYEATVNRKKLEDDLWSWLGRLDPGEDSRTLVMEEPEKNPKLTGEDQGDTWSAYLRESHAAKEKLDQHMASLENMIRRAGNKIGSVDQVVEHQRQRILQNWSKH